MSFYDEYAGYSEADIDAVLKNTTPEKIVKIIEKNSLTARDFLALLSPAAADHLEIMAQKAHQLTVQNFGHVIFLFTPIYLSDYCTNKCVYCGFNITNTFTRKKLTLEEVEKEAKRISASGA